MFGNNNDDTDTKTQDPTNGFSMPVDPPMTDGNGAPTLPDAAGTSTTNDTTAPPPAPLSESDAPAAAEESQSSTSDTTSEPASLEEPELPASPIASDDLVHIKKQALAHLSPLVSHLDQTPEEKFRTTMMMIQASDDQTLLNAAFDAAKAITDDKARAQALLDVINEINYFTQQNHTS